MATKKKKTETVVEQKKPELITKLTEKEIQEYLEKEGIKMPAVRTYNKCYVKNWIVIANDWINVFLKDKNHRVYTVSHWYKFDTKELEFVWAIQTISHPEPIVFIL